MEYMSVHQTSDGHWFIQYGEWNKPGAGFGVWGAMEQKSQIGVTSGDRLQSTLSVG